MLLTGGEINDTYKIQHMKSINMKRFGHLCNVQLLDQNADERIALKHIYVTYRHGL